MSFKSATNINLKDEMYHKNNKWAKKRHKIMLTHNKCPKFSLKVFRHIKSATKKHQ